MPKATAATPTLGSSIRTESSYRDWIKRFILFHGKRHPREMGAEEVSRFLSDLAVRGRVAASTQNQAFNALLFLYREVLHQELGLPRQFPLAPGTPRRFPSKRDLPGVNGTYRELPGQNHTFSPARLSAPQGLSP